MVACLELNATDLHLIPIADAVTNSSYLVFFKFSWLSHVLRNCHIVAVCLSVYAHLSQNMLPFLHYLLLQDRCLFYPHYNSTDQDSNVGSICIAVNDCVV